MALTCTSQTISTTSCTCPIQDQRWERHTCNVTTLSSVLHALSLMESVILLVVFVIVMWQAASVHANCHHHHCAAVVSRVTWLSKGLSVPFPVCIIRQMTAGLSISVGTMYRCSKLLNCHSMFILYSILVLLSVLFCVEMWWNTYSTKLCSITMHSTDSFEQTFWLTDTIGLRVGSVWLQTFDWLL